MSNSQKHINQSLFRQILKRGFSVYTSLLSLSFLLSPLPATRSRFALVVSGKTLKRAVDRHKLKRRGRHIIYKNLDQIKNGFLGIFFFKQGAPQLPFKDLEETMLKLLNQANLLR